MRLRGKILSLLLAAVMLMPYTLCMAQESEATEVIYIEDFESYDLGKPTTSNFTMNHKGNVWGVTMLPSGGKAMHMRVAPLTPLIDIHIDKVFSAPVTGKFILEADFIIEDYGNANKVLQITDSSNRYVILGKFEPNGAFTLNDGTVVNGYVPGKTYRISYNIDIDNRTFDVYFNGRKRITNHIFHNINVNDVARLRVQVQAPAEETGMYLDNIKVYRAPRPIVSTTAPGENSQDIEKEDTPQKMGVDEEARMIAEKSTCLYVNKPNAMLKGQKGYITQSRDVMPYKKGNDVFVPVSYFARSIGVTPVRNANHSVVISKGDKSLEVAVGNSYISLNGENMAIAQAIEEKNGEIYAPVIELCDAFDQYLFLDSSGLMIYSATDYSLSWEDKLAVLRRIAENFIYDDVKGSEIVSMIKQKHPDKNHPRLLITEEKLAVMRSEIANGNEVYVKAFEAVKSLADSYLNTEPHFYEITDGVRLLYVARRISDTILALAMTYNLTLDEKYAIRCRQELISASSFKDWHPYHFLDTGELTNAVALGYDWLYNWLDEEDRAFIRKAIVTKGIDRIIDDYDEKTLLQSDQSNLLSRTWRWRGEPVCNWRFVCGGGVSVGAMAVCDEVSDTDRVKCEKVLEQSLIDIRPAISLFAPYGGYEEGIDYWGYATKYYAYHMGSLQTAAGNDFGYTDAPGLRDTNDYVYAVNGPSGVFSYHDCGVWESQIDPYVLFWAKRFNNPQSALPRVEKILAGEGNVHDLLYYDKMFAEAEGANLKNDILLSSTGIFTARSGWDENATYVGFHADEAIKGAGHAHNDGGTFILQAMGEAFFKDIGSDDYNIPEYRKVYRVRAEGHNTIVINPQKNDADMVFASKSEIIRSETAPRGAYAIADLTDLYRDDVNSAVRGVKLDNDRSTVTVQDEIVMKEPSEFYWFAHTEANIDISEDGRKAYLTLNGKTLLAELTGDENARFTAMPAEPLPTSSNPAGQASRAHYHKLAIHMENVEKVNIAVIFNGYGADYDEASYSKEWIALDDWSVPDGKYVTEYAVADSIEVNGVPIADFNPDVYEYNVTLSPDDWVKPVVTASAKTEVSIKQADAIGGSAYIRVAGADGKRAKGYTVTFNVTGYAEGTDGKNEIKPVAITASRVPQVENAPENISDNNPNTRWSCDGLCWIEYDLGEVYSLDAVSLSFMNGLSRTAQFEIRYSEDGKTYRTAYRGDSIRIDALETHPLFGEKARFVRLYCYGHSNVRYNWNSVTELKVFAVKN